MRRILTSEESDPSWSKRAVAQLQLQREFHAFLDDNSVPIEEGFDGRCRWWTFGGGAGTAFSRNSSNWSLASASRPATPS